MRKLLVAFSLLAVGCVTSVDQPGPGVDGGGAGEDLAECQGCNSTDMARVIVDLAGVDLAGNSTKAAFGATCVQNSDCQSNMCEQFRMHTVNFCTQPCTAATQTTDCPAPPSAGTCTPNLWCRFN
ncbi:MAG TPA: hypothetical protein VFF06_20650 [Polyangia bacterium]|nr:hypothetical protein [Polyangia bacterium]